MSQSNHPLIDSERTYEITGFDLYLYGRSHEAVLRATVIFILALFGLMFSVGFVVITRQYDASTALPVGVSFGTLVVGVIQLIGARRYRESTLALVTGQYREWKEKHP